MLTSLWELPTWFKVSNVCFLISVFTTPNSNASTNDATTPTTTIRTVMDATTGEEQLHIGTAHVTLNNVSKAPLLVPHLLFYENERQNIVLQDMLNAFKVGEHLLLIGNQGVGKNKLADYFLKLMRLPREYIQLHRDTTVRYIDQGITCVCAQHTAAVVCGW